MALISSSMPLKITSQSSMKPAKKSGRKANRILLNKFYRLTSTPTKLLPVRKRPRKAKSDNLLLLLQKNININHINIICRVWNNYFCINIIQFFVSFASKFHIFVNYKYDVEHGYVDVYVAFSNLFTVSFILFWKLVQRD